MPGAATSRRTACAQVGETKDTSLAAQLVERLCLADSRSAPSEAHMFQLYMKLGDFDKAAHTMVLIARQEQEMGNYKLAHSKLARRRLHPAAAPPATPEPLIPPSPQVDTHKELVAQGRRPPQELARALGLLHSYILVKSHVKLGDHTTAALLLARVAKSISRFPAHVVPILTSTVIECQRAGMKRVAFEHASTLMRPEHRQSIAEAYKRKIETIVRKRDVADEASEPQSECPFCSALGGVSELQCATCQSVIPYCIATGWRLTKENCAQCPSCRFPCEPEAFKRIVGDDAVIAQANPSLALHLGCHMGGWHQLLGADSRCPHRCAPCATSRWCCLPFTGWKTRCHS